MTTYFISDTHFFHKKILEFSGDFRDGNTVPEHDEILLDKINRTVNQNDLLWLLGDCVFGNKEKNLPILNRIKCENKKLILGNHDSGNIRNYLPYFIDIKGVVNYKEFLLQHTPLKSCEDFRYSKYNIHGHTHNHNINQFGRKYFNVCVEALGGYPISVDKIRELIKMDSINDVMSYMERHKRGLSI